MISRREPLLWLQLMALAVIPLELELLRLVLAGPAFGPAPALERLLIWGLAVVAPGVLLWRRSPDWASLLLVRIPASKRSIDQRRLSAAQQPLGLKAALVIGIALLLALFWWIDRSALLVVELSPTSDSSRLTALLIAAPLLALMLWQWQQLVQAIWLLTRSDQAFTDLTPINAADLQTNHLSLGLGLLQLPTLRWEATVEPGQSTQTSSSGKGDHDLNPTVPDPAPDPQPASAEIDGDEVVQEDVPEAIHQEPEVIAADEQESESDVASTDIEANETEQEPLNEPSNDEQHDQNGADSVVAGSDAETGQPSIQQSAADSAPDPQPEPAEIDGDEIVQDDVPEAIHQEPEVIAADEQESESDVASTDIEANETEQEPLNEPSNDEQHGQDNAESVDAGSDPETDQPSIQQSAADSAPDPQPEPAEIDGDEIVQEDVPEAIHQEPEVIAADEQESESDVASADFEANETEQEPLNEPSNDEQHDQNGADSVDGGSDAETDQPSIQQSAADSVPTPQLETAEATAEEDLSEDSSSRAEDSSAESEAEPTSAVAPVAIKPEQAAEEDHSPDLDGQVSADGTVTSTDAETHHEEAKTSGSEQGDPEQSAQPPPGSP